MTTMKANAAWDTASVAVRDHADELRQLTTHTELFGWAKEHDLNTKMLFPKFKTELRKQLHIDYDELRDQAMVEREAALSAAAEDESVPTIALWTAGDAEVDSFAVCNGEGGDPWYGTFHERDAVTDQDEADLAAARKAVYLAEQARKFAELDVVRLALVVSNHRVTAETLRKDAVRGRVVVDLEVVDGENPALEVCRLPGYRTWREVSLTDLVGQE